ncbi:MAG: hypothetical protein R3C59_03120 [Planctomycetaceae bacterium]
MLSGDNRVPVFTFAAAPTGVVVVEFEDDTLSDVTVFVDAHADGSYESSEPMQTDGIPTIVWVDAEVPPNGSIQANVKAVRTVFNEDEGAEADQIELTSEIITVTVQGVELLPIPPLELDVHTETVWGQIDEDDVVGSVQIVMKWDDGDWVDLGDPMVTYGSFHLAVPVESIGKEVTVTTRHSLHGVDVYGPLETFENPSIEEQLFGSGGDDDGGGETGGGGAEEVGGPDGIEDPDPVGSGGASTPPAVPPSTGNDDDEIASVDDSAIDEMMASLTMDDDWYFSDDTGSETDSADYADFFTA